LRDIAAEEAEEVPMPASTHKSPAALDTTFTTEILKSEAKGGWTYLVWPGSAAFFGTRGLVKVRGTIEGRPFESAFMAMGGGVHKLPVTTELRRAIGKDVGGTVTVHLEQRMN
jgi:hypothetical protein